MIDKLKKEFGAQDMTRGGVIKCILRFSIPLLIGNMAQQLYNTVDSIIVGRYIGDTALAAVGVSNPVMNLLYLLFMGISTGAGILVSQYFGAKKREELTCAVGTCLALTAAASIFVMIVGPLIAGPIMTLLDTPPEEYDMAVTYLTIILGLMAGTGFYNIGAGILRGVGDSVTPLIFLIISCLTNVVLDIVFIRNLSMGVAGVAWATIISQFLSATLCMLKISRMKDVFALNRKALMPRKDKAKQIITLGLPSGLASAIYSISAMVVQALINSFGTSVMAVSVVVMRVDGFAMLPNFTFGMAMTTFIGQNVGARNMERAKEGAWKGTVLAIAVATVLVACILTFGPYLMELFTETEEVITMGVHMMQILAVGYIAMSVTQCLSGVMRGAGDTMTPMWISLVTTVIVRVPIAYGLAALSRSETMPNGNPDCIFVSLLISWIIGALLTFVLYKKGKWRRTAQVTISV